MAITDLTLNTTSICNLSLSHLGMKPITNLTTDAAANNPSALAINKNWGPVRNDLFGEFDWSFAKVQARMYHRTDITDEDYPEWQFYTTYPSSAANVWSVFDEATVDRKDENEFEVFYDIDLDERILCCNLDTQNAAYYQGTYNVTDPTYWDTKFVMAFSYRLAAAICFELTGDAQKTQELKELSIAYIHDSKRIDSHKKKKKPERTNSIVEARG